MGLSTLTGRCWQALAATVPGFRPVPDEHVVLVGGHGMDDGARGVLNASRVTNVPTADILARGPG
jgi:arginase